MPKTRSSPDAVLVSRLGDGTIVNVNEGFVALSGFRKDECVGKTTLAVNVWKWPRDRESVVNELRRTGGCRNYEAVFQRKDGSELPGLLSAVVFSLQDVPHVISVMRDITDRKRVEAEKAELEVRNHQLQKVESLGRMAGAIAHHFNNRLQAVMGNLELALEEQKQGACATETLNEAMASARQATTVSGMMLTYLGKDPVRLEPLDLGGACRQALPKLRDAMPRGVALDTNLPASGPVIDASPHQFRQLLGNLITNAWESLADGQGSVRLTISTVSPADIAAAPRYPLDWQPQARAYVCLEVADTGCGIAPETLAVLFDPFVSTKFTGRGLGLAVVLGILRTHDGVITVGGEPGRGSTFRVFFPVSVHTAPQAARVAPVPDTAPAGSATLVQDTPGGGTVLVVEDDAGVRRVAARMLMRLGFAVVEARDGAEALELFPKHRDGIRVVLCDLTMPRLNGWQTLTALRQLAPGIPFILSSGYDEASAMAGDHPEQPHAFVSKPYQFEDLRAAIGKAGDASENRDS
jgi:two-component system cell cycle sensor histidine kinase/response regulator CckA